MEAFKINREAIVGLEEFKNNLLASKYKYTIKVIRNNLVNELSKISHLKNPMSYISNDYFNNIMNESIILGLDLNIKEGHSFKYGVKHLDVFSDKGIIISIPSSLIETMHDIKKFIQFKIIVEAYIYVSEPFEDIFIKDLEILFHKVFRNLVKYKNKKSIFNNKFLESDYPEMLLDMKDLIVYTDIDYTNTILSMIIKGFGCSELKELIDKFKNNKVDDSSYEIALDNVLKEFTKYLTEVKDKRTIKDMTLPLGEPFHNDIEEDEEELGE